MNKPKVTTFKSVAKRLKVQQKRLPPPEEKSIIKKTKDIETFFDGEFDKMKHSDYWLGW